MCNEDVERKVEDEKERIGGGENERTAWDCQRGMLHYRRNKMQRERVAGKEMYFISLSRAARFINLFEIRAG